MTKLLLLFSAPALAFADLVHAGAQEIVLLGAAGAVLRAVWVRVVLPLSRLIHRALTRLEVLDHLPDFIAEVDERLDHVEGALGIPQPSRAGRRRRGGLRPRPTT